MCGLGKFCSQFALFTEKFTQSTKFLRDRWSHRSRQISSLYNRFAKRYFRHFFYPSTKFTVFNVMTNEIKSHMLKDNTMAKVLK